MPVSDCLRPASRLAAVSYACMAWPVILLIAIDLGVVRDSLHRHSRSMYCSWQSRSRKRGLILISEANEIYAKRTESTVSPTLVLSLPDKIQLERSGGMEGGVRRRGDKRERYSPRLIDRSTRRGVCTTAARTKPRDDDVDDEDSTQRRGTMAESEH